LQKGGFSDHFDPDCRCFYRNKAKSKEKLLDRAPIQADLRFLAKRGKSDGKYALIPLLIRHFREKVDFIDQTEKKCGRCHGIF